MCGASAFHTRSTELRSVSQYVETGAGRTAENTFPSGQMTFSGRKQPSFTGVSGLVSALKMVRIPPIRPVRVQLTGPAACGPEPVQSATNRSEGRSVGEEGGTGRAAGSGTRTHR